MSNTIRRFSKYICSQLKNLKNVHGHKKRELIESTIVVTVSLSRSSICSAWLTWPLIKNGM